MWWLPWKSGWTAASPAWPSTDSVSSGFVGTSIADLAGALGVSKAAIYYHYRSKDTLLHRLIDPLLDAIDTCLQDHTTPGPDTASSCWTPTWPSCSPTARSSR